MQSATHTNSVDQATTQIATLKRRKAFLAASLVLATWWTIYVTAMSVIEMAKMPTTWSIPDMFSSQWFALTANQVLTACFLLLTCWLAYHFVKTSTSHRELLVGYTTT